MSTLAMETIIFGAPLSSVVSWEIPRAGEFLRHGCGYHTNLLDFPLSLSNLHSLALAETISSPHSDVVLSLISSIRVH